MQIVTPQQGPGSSQAAPAAADAALQGSSSDSHVTTRVEQAEGLHLKVVSIHRPAEDRHIERLLVGHIVSMHAAFSSGKA